ncbi:hypothetical protein A3767_20230, partial [Oleiphilus sp. HI0133]
MNDGIKRAFSQQALKAFAKDVGRSYWILLKIMVPAVVIVKLLDELGATEFLAMLLSPLMGVLGLPSEFGLVWAASILTNIYGAMVVFYQLSDGASYSVAQISVMSMLVLVAHALPIEGAVAKALGVRWRVTILLRIVGSYVFALFVHLAMQFSDLETQPSVVLWSPTPSGDSLTAWLLSQLEMLIGILVILASLMAFLRFLTLIGFDKVLNILLLPLTRLLRVDKEASQVTIVGLMLGLSFGAGLLIDAAEKGTISSRDMKIVACFLGLCHSLIEDTLLVLLLGAHWVPVLLGRLLFSIVV